MRVSFVNCCTEMDGYRTYSSTLHYRKRWSERCRSPKGYNISRSALGEASSIQTASVPIAVRTAMKETRSSSSYI